jgi:hypothetical protein
MAQGRDQDASVLRRCPDRSRVFAPEAPGVRGLAFPTLVPCPRSLRVAMSLGFGIAAASGESFTASIPTPS